MQYFSSLLLSQTVFSYLKPILPIGRISSVIKYFTLFAVRYLKSVSWAKKCHLTSDMNPSWTFVYSTFAWNCVFFSQTKLSEGNIVERSLLRRSSFLSTLCFFWKPDSGLFFSFPSRPSRSCRGTPLACWRTRPSSWRSSRCWRRRWGRATACSSSASRSWRSTSWRSSCRGDASQVSGHAYKCIVQHRPAGHSLKKVKANPKKWTSWIFSRDNPMGAPLFSSINELIPVWHHFMKVDSLSKCPLKSKW